MDSHLGDRVPMGTFSVFWVPIGSPFLFQGPHFLYLGLRKAWKVNAANNLINCDNTPSTNESHACLSVSEHFPLLLNALFQWISLFRSILQTFAFWVPILLPRVPIWSPFHWNLGPHRIPILKKVGPHANWEQWICTNLHQFTTICINLHKFSPICTNLLTKTCN